jgi:hypothetical protein
MAISTGPKKQISSEERKKMIAELREYHLPYLESLEDGNWRFIAKMRFGYPPDRTKFFENEIDGSKEVYVEWVSRTYIPEDDRRLYKYNFNPDYAKDYVKETSAEGYEWYIVPADRFELVKEGETKTKLESIKEPRETHVDTLEFDFDMVNPDEDCPAENITLRDWAAMLLKAPVSRKEWLNKLIKESCQK